MRKKIIKYISVLVACIIAFSSFYISVSAATEDSNGYYFNIQQPVANSNSGYIELLCENVGPVLIYFNASFQHSFHGNNVNDSSFNFFATVEQNRLIIRNQGQIGAVDGFNNTQYVVIWGFYITPLGWSEWMHSSYDDDAVIFPYNTFNLSLANFGNVTHARGYNCNLESVGASENFKPFVYGSNTAMYNEMKVIENLLSQNISGNQAIINNANQNASNIQSNANNNASAIQSNADKNASAIQSNANKNSLAIQSNADKNASAIQSNADDNASDIQANADKNASQIQQNQDKNTDKILNGDSDLDSSGETNKVNGTVGGIDDATDEALGGKSEAEIQSEVDGALDPKQLGNIDVTKAKRMSTFYDRCLKSFGTAYNSLLLLSLVLGLGAFLIGRRYG